MKDGFYLADEKHKKVTGEVVEHKDVLYFRQARSGFDNKATKEHVKSHPSDFQNFKNAHPDYKLPDSFVDVEIGSALVHPKIDDVSLSPLVNESKAADAILEKKEAKHVEAPKAHGKGKHE